MTPEGYHFAFRHVLQRLKRALPGPTGVLDLKDVRVQRPEQFARPFGVVLTAGWPPSGLGSPRKNVPRQMCTADVTPGPWPV